MLFLFPLILWLLMGSITVLFRGAKSIAEAWRGLALPVAIIAATGHMAKGLAKIASWGGFLPYALQDPFGIETAHSMTAKLIPHPEPLMSKEIVSVLGLIVIIVRFILAVRESRIAHPETHIPRMIPKFALVVLFAFLVFGWSSLYFHIF